MSELVVYPSEVLPLPQLSAHKIDKNSGVLVTKMDSGQKRRRRRFKNVPISISVKFLFTSEEYSLFESWYEFQINGGADRFVMPIKTATGLQLQSAEFDGGYSAKPKTVNRWEVTAKIEVKKIDPLDSSYASLIFELGYSVSSFGTLLPAIEQTVNHNTLNG